MATLRRVGAVILLAFVFILPFFNGGNSFFAFWLLLILPLPLMLLAPLPQRLPRLGPFLLFWLALFLSSLKAVNLMMAGPTFLAWSALFVFFYLFLAYRGYYRWQIVLRLFFLTAFVLSLISLYCLIFSSRCQGLATMNFFYAVYGHNHLADYLCLVFPLSLAAFFRHRYRWPLFFLNLFFLISIWLTFSRTSFLFLPPLLIVLWYFWRPRFFQGQVLFLLALLVSFALAVLALVVGLGRGDWLVNYWPWLGHHLARSLQSEARPAYWQQAWSAFSQRPFLGWGWGNFRLVSLRFSRNPFNWAWFPHNFFLRLLAETGLVGFLTFVVLLWQIKHHLKKAASRWGITGAFLFSMSHALLDFDWAFRAIILSLLIFLALSLARRPISQMQAKIWHGFFFFLAGMGFLAGSLAAGGKFLAAAGYYRQSFHLYPFAAKVLRASIANGEKLPPSWALKWDRGDYDLYLLLAQEEKEAGHYQQADAWLAKAVTWWPSLRLGWQRREAIFRQLGKSPVVLWRQQLAAVKGSGATLCFHGYYAKIAYRLGIYYFQHERYREAETYLKEAVRLAPQWSYFHRALADFYAFQGRKALARQVLQKCQKLYFPRWDCRQQLERGKWDLPDALAPQVKTVFDN